AIYDEESLGAKFEWEPVPADMQEQCEALREQLVEACAEVDDSVMERWLEGGAEAVSTTDIYRAVRAGCLSFKFVPVVCGSAFKNKGVQQLLDAVVNYLPAPTDVADVEGVDPKTGDVLTRPTRDDAPFAALAFKIANDPFVGNLTFFRVYSGTVSSGTAVYNP